jgi:hypothetical protein
MRFGELEDALAALAPGERLAAREHEEARAPVVVSVADDAVDRGPVELLAVLARVRVAAHAGEVARLAGADGEEVGRCRAAVPGAEAVLRALVATVNEHVGEQRLQQRPDRRAPEPPLGERPLRHLQERQAECHLVLLDSQRVAQLGGGTIRSRPQAPLDPVRQRAADGRNATQRSGAPRETLERPVPEGSVRAVHWVASRVGLLATTPPHCEPARGPGSMSYA